MQALCVAVYGGTYVADVNSTNTHVVNEYHLQKLHHLDENTDFRTFRLSKGLSHASKPPK